MDGSALKTLKGDFSQLKQYLGENSMSRWQDNIEKSRMSYKDNICQVKHSDRSSKGRVTLITLMLFITRLMFPSKIHLLPIHHKQIQEDNLINNRLVQTLFSQVKMLFSNRFRIE